jgi:osmotically inducible protein OsmC
MPTRKASAVWNGDLKGGNGTFKSETGLGGSYNFTRFADQSGGTNPEELLAAAEAACFSMALSGALGKNGTPPTKVTTDAACTIEKVGEGFTITKMALNVTATVPKIDAATFERIAQQTKDGCPVSRALKGVDISVTARLG